MGRSINPNPTPYRLTIGDRRGDMRLRRQAPGMTYHHIIPFNVLRDFWNTAVERGDLEQLRETVVPALMRSMGAYAIDQADPGRARALIASAGRLLRMIWLGNYVHDPGRPSPAGIDDFKAIYTWMPGNLFSGPTVRPDDPEERFDSFASRCVEEGRYLAALGAFRAIRAYLDQPPGIGPAAHAARTRASARAGQLAHAAGLALARVAEYAEPTPYDPARW